MKKKILLSMLSVLFIHSFSQGYNEEQIVLTNFLKRMYNQTAFEGVKIVEDYDNQYLISVLSLEKSRYQKQSDMFRVAQVKAQRQASEFINGGTIASDMIIYTTETKNATGVNGNVTVETVEKIRSVGFVQGMELLINFTPTDETQMVFIYARKIEKEK
ncbi:MAG: hypothetical protein LBI60_01685 [Bacteroidales bacterium]|jgi:hypothetical protein|nr:hypothetical protein [Bacteroidales bacterium]